MILNCCLQRGRKRLRTLLLTLTILTLTLVFLGRNFRSQPYEPHIDLGTTPLIREYIIHGSGQGGRWYIPSSWLAMAAAAGGTNPLVSSTKPQSVLEAAQLALELSLRNHKFARSSKIPLLTHQTWKTLNPEAWPPLVQESVEGWLNASTGVAFEKTPEMAYILWDDDGMDSLIKQYEPDLWRGFQQLPFPVEKADAFRVTVLRWFGGFYADVDVKLLQHPSQWIHEKDVDPWTDTETDQTFSLEAPTTKRYNAPPNSPQKYQTVLSLYRQDAVDVSAMYGIEADTPPEKDDYWRMGYSYPVQITNWALAMAPHHPTAARYIGQVTDMIKNNATKLSDVDPLDLTGPPALTKAVKNHCEDISTRFQWNAISGLHDPPGGRGKVIGHDILILPITGFSPGRGWFHNMGSQSLTHPNARLHHAAAGSWRKPDLKVHLGKLCRTIFGGCKDWKKIP